MSTPHDNLAEQALDNLVNQFARPLDFLRELVQNSIDAGSPRIEIRIDFRAPAQGEDTGVLQIHVDDWGEGMDEEIIDNQLTRLFSSAKEGDLTKIGKFGIGFTSIFAIQPEAVLLKTGRHGENWEILFHQNRSYQKKRIAEPIDGTKITLFKRKHPDEIKEFVDEARFILTYWCEHSNIPVTFWDRTKDHKSPKAPPTDDPFAAFSSPSPEQGSAATINRPLALDADLSLPIHTPDVEAIIGLEDEPRYGFYNAGLTLLSTQNTEALGDYRERLRAVSFKLKSNALEHTLTRDNVLQDEHWKRAMELLVASRIPLTDELLKKLSEAIRTRTDYPRWQEHLATLCRSPSLTKHVRNSADTPLFVSGLGEPLSLADIEKNARKYGIGEPLLAGKNPTLTERLFRELKIQVVEDTPASQHLLSRFSRTGVFSTTEEPPPLRSADELFVIPEVLDPSELDEGERTLTKLTKELLYQSTNRSLYVRIGNFGGIEASHTEALALNGPEEGGVFQRPSPHGTWRWLKSFLLTRTVLINRNHPLFRAQLLAATEQPWLAAAGLAAAILHEEDLEGSRAYSTLLTLAHQRIKAAQ